MRVSAALAFGLPADASAEGWRIDGILQAAHVATGALALVVMLWLAIVLVRDRRRQIARVQNGKEYLVPLFLAAFVLFVVDGYLLWRSHGDLRESILAVDAVETNRPHLKVQIAARQWGWETRYAGADGLFDTEDDIYASRLVVPVDMPVVYELSSLDVVHALYLPNFRIKQDAVPGRVARGWFVPTKIGRYEIACAQHCGVHHFQMSAQLDVVGAENYSYWLRDMSRESALLFAETLRASEGEPTPGPSPRNWAWPWKGAGS